MTTLQAIGFTCAGSLVVAMCAFIFFSFAIRMGSPKVAPRCTARSKETVYNPKVKRKRSLFASLCRMLQNSHSNYKKDDGGKGSTGKKNVDVESFKNDGSGLNKKNTDTNFGSGNAEYNGGGDDDYVDDDREHVQYRGGPMFGWIPWTLSLSYEQLLKGVPGTGTRKNGMDGSMLKVNLDGIVLLRFHAICLRIAILGTILALGIVLPINLTADCYWDEESESFKCFHEKTLTNLTNYEITTIENIPILEVDDEAREKYGWQISIFGASLKIFGSNYGSFLGRLYAIVGVSWIMILYCLRILKKEWVDALALRRVFYLEGRHWENRIQELNDTVLNQEAPDSDDEEDEKAAAFLRKRRMINKGKVKKQMKKKKKKRVMNDRDPWIPHPEQRDTVPNIELYSVLVGQIPALTSEIAGDDHSNTAGADMKSAIDWQLRVTTTFFDQCVPNQPGFSSSVAAVTILPDAPKLALAWKTWYRHCSLLRRLRFIRNLIAERRHYDIDECIENYQDDEGETVGKAGNESSGSKNAGKVADVEAAPPEFVGSQDYLDDDYPGAELSERERDEYAAIQQRIDYYSNVFGAEFNDVAYEDNIQNKETLMTQILSYGPEQTAIYSKEFAMGASKCCPNGCREDKLREQMSLRDLEELELELETSVRLSFERLKEVQQSNVIRDESDHNAKTNNDVEMQLYAQTPTKFTASNDPNTSYDTSLYINTQSTEQHQNLDGLQLQQTNEEPYNNPNSAPPRTLPPSPFRPIRRNSSPHSVQNSSVPPLPQQQMIITNQGKVLYKDIGGGSHMSENEDMSHIASWSVNGQRAYHQEGGHIILNDQSTVQYYPSRRRLDTGGFSQMTLEKVEENRVSEWEKVQQAVQDNHAASGKKHESRRISSGAWKVPSIIDVLRRLWHQIRVPFKKTIDAVDEFKSTSTFAVVTFTSRQAAVAARHCLSDGRGVGRWIPVEDIPVPPLADASVCDFCDCRGCCRPVTLTINPKQQYLRRCCTFFMLGAIFVFYTLPLTFAAALIAPEKLNNIIPGIEDAAKDNPLLNNLFTGILPAVFYSIFFALCPVLFKSLSNFGSNAVSVNQAEFIALQYYWWFMLITAFSGTSLTTMALNFFNASRDENPTIQSVLLSIAATLPRQVSATWLNWIIFRTFCTLPLMYMLNIHTFIFEMLGWKCCIRCVMGGGPGGPIPYRIYIDSGVVFMCVIGLSPISPLLAPVGLCYFLFCAPLWRRNCIYMYRPFFDTGGIRWPFLSDVLLSAICVSQILLCATMAVKRALGPAILSSLVLIPVYLHRRSTRKKYYRSYMDAALLQTSQLDGWDNSQSTSKEMREEYRKFLVDAHRAAYVPICLAGDQARGLTNEPAVVIPHPNDILEPLPLHNPDYEHETEHSVATPISAHHPFPSFGLHQPGASFRRVLQRQSFADDMSSSMGNSTRPPVMIHQAPRL